MKTKHLIVLTLICSFVAAVACTPINKSGGCPSHDKNYFRR